MNPNIITRPLPLGLLAMLGMALSPAAHAVVLAEFNFDGGSATSTDSSTYSSVSAYDARTAAIAAADGAATAYDDDSAVSSFSNTAFMRAENTPGSTSPVGSVFYHTFNMTVQNLGAGETLNLTTLNFDYFAEDIFQSFFLGVYSDAVGYTGFSDKLATTNINTNAGATFNIDLTSANSVAGTAFTGLTNGETIEFRFHFADNSTSNGRIHRLDNITLNGVAVPEPSSAALLGLGGLALILHRRK